MKVLKYGFYCFYRFMKSVGNGDIAEYYASILMSVFLSLNTFAFISLLDIVSGIKINICQYSNLIICLLFFGLLILFYILFIKKNRYLEIIKEYGQETAKKKIIGNVVFIGYILVSVGLLMLCFYLTIQRNMGII